MKTRIADSKDVATISSILATSWNSAYRGIVDDDYLDLLNSNHWIDFLASGLNAENIFAMILENDQYPMGAAIIGKEQYENTAILISFYLLPDQIGIGVGHVFYSDIEDELKRRGFTSCILDVLENNERAIRFYESHGFMVTSKTTKTVLGNREYHCKVYEKQLG